MLLSQIVSCLSNRQRDKLVIVIHTEKIHISISRTDKETKLNLSHRQTAILVLVIQTEKHRKSCQTSI